MKREILQYCLLILLVVFSSNIMAQKKKIVKPTVKQIAFKVELVRSINFDSTVTHIEYAQGKFFSFAKDGKISCVDTLGKLVWSSQSPSRIIVKPAIIENTIVAATENNEIVTFNLKNGVQLQSIGTEEKVTTPLFTFNYSGTNELMIPKLTNSKAAVIFGTADGKFFCLDLETLQEYWQNSDKKDSLFTVPILINNKLVFSRGDGSINCADSRTNLLLWRWIDKNIADFSKSEIITDNKDLFVVSSDSILHSINFLLGRLNWRFEKAKLLQKVFYSNSNKSLYLISNRNKIIVFFLLDEKVVDEFSLKQFNFANSFHFFEFNNKTFLLNGNFIFSFLDKEKPKDIFKFSFDNTMRLEKLNKNTFAAINGNGTCTIFRMRQIEKL